MVGLPVVIGTRRVWCTLVIENTDLNRSDTYCYSVSCEVIKDIIDRSPKTQTLFLLTMYHLKFVDLHVSFKHVFLSMLIS